ncbi:restriction endonuclease subunit S [Methanolobus mangrovi]|uniref:Restriction endonuclease subunit S n=1 Tax=Methanolobus mangrovi TaxID=3072977 RepID=A0AA51YJN0_9EURY|nr:restriction endonuclease subunit S [Methanolobus mangrovi]WMW22773.1 restriction endonuclease subunit S [Methanolobus mangrovi]
MISNLSEVPPNWIKVRFDQIAENITDRIEKPNESGLEYYIGLEHLDTDQIRIKRFGSTEDVKATKFLCKKGDIIFGKRNAYLRKVAVTDRDAVVSAHSMVIRPISDLIVPDFLPCFMQSSIFWKTAHAISEGSMSPTIKWKTLAKQEFYIPSIEEQKKVSEVLWAIEGNIEHIENIVDISQNFKRGLLNELLSKGIGHNNSTTIKNNEIPINWELCLFTDAINVNPSRKISKGKICKYVAMEDVIEFHEEICNYSERVFKNGGAKFTKEDTLLARITPCLENGKTAYVNVLDEDEIGFGSTEFIVLSGKKGVTLNKYVYYIATSPFFRKNAIASMRGTTGRQRVPNDFFDSIHIAIPPIEEQKEIIELLEKSGENILNYKSHLTSVINLKKKLTDDFLSGNLKNLQEALQNVQ